MISVSRNGDGFALELETGERLNGEKCGDGGGHHMVRAHAPALKNFPIGRRRIPIAHRDVSQFKDRDVAVLGAGASAVDLAALLHDSGANVQIVARTRSVRFHARPDPQDASLLRQIKSPPTGIGPGWRSFFCANTPLLFHRLPEALRLRATRNHLAPRRAGSCANAWRAAFPCCSARSVNDAAVARAISVELQLADAAGEKRTAIFDHVIAATGYRPDLARLPFLALSLLAEIADGGKHADPDRTSSKPPRPGST